MISNLVPDKLETSKTAIKPVTNGIKVIAGMDIYCSLINGEEIVMMPQSSLIAIRQIFLLMAHLKSFSVYSEMI